KQNHVHTEVQPEHDKDNGRQTPVHSGKSLKNVQIDRENQGNNLPANCAENRSWYLMLPFGSDFYVRQKAVQKHTEQHHYSDCQRGSDSDQKVNCLLQHRSVYFYENADPVSEYGKEKAGNYNQKKQHRVNGCSKSQIEIVSRLLALINTVESGRYRKHPSSSRPQCDKDRHWNDCCGLAVYFIDNGYQEGRDSLREYLRNRRHHIASCKRCILYHSH